MFYRCTRTLYIIDVRGVKDKVPSALKDKVYEFKPLRYPDNDLDVHFVNEKNLEHVWHSKSLKFRTYFTKLEEKPNEINIVDLI